MTDLTVLDETPGRAPRPAIAAHQHRLVGRLLATVSTPGGAIFVLAALLLVATIMANPNFGDPGVVIRFFGRTAPIAIAAIGQYYVIVSGEFDLSMAAVISMQVVLAGNYIGEDTGRILPGIILMLVLGAGIGVINGLATTVLRVPSFIVTLGMMLALAGIVDWRTGGAANQNPADDFREIGRGFVDNVPVVEVIPYPLIILLVISVLAAWLMRRPFGRSLIAAGDNPEAAHLAGTSLVWLKTRAFVLSSLSATVAGILLVGYAGVHPSVGQGYEFTADHRRRARRRAARRRPRLGALRSGGCLHARAALHLPHRPGRRVDLEADRAGRDHHPRRRRGRPCLDRRPPPLPPWWHPAYRSFQRNTQPIAHPGHDNRRQLMRRTKLTGVLGAAALVLALGGLQLRRLRRRRPQHRHRRHPERGHRRRPKRSASSSTRPTWTSRTSSARPPSRVTPPRRGCSTSTAR